MNDVEIVLQIILPLVTTVGTCVIGYCFSKLKQRDKEEAKRIAVDNARIGYHFVIRKDGTIERGHPEWAIGYHAQGHNFNSIGIHLCGDFNTAQPTDIQIESAALLIANLCADYNIPTDRNHIIGHDECYISESSETTVIILLGLSFSNAVRLILQSKTLSYSAGFFFCL